MANTILYAQGFDIGKSLHEKRMTQFCDDLIKEFSEKILLPIDAIVIDKKFTTLPEVKLIEKIDKNDMIVDIGPQSRMLFYNELLKTNTLLWNGPLGLFERKPFDEGTEYVLGAVRSNKNKNFFSVAGGGDTISILNNVNCFNDFSFVSTGGGAFLEFVQGASMPGLTSLNH
jgi:phosphoglycerate kinase